MTRGICRATPEGVLTNIVEVSGLLLDRGAVRITDAPADGPNPTGSELASMNFWGFTPALFPQFASQFEDFLRANLSRPKAELVIPTVVGELVKHGLARVAVLPTTSTWFGITNPQDKQDVAQRVRRLVAAGKYPTDLWRVST